MTAPQDGAPLTVITIGGGGLGERHALGLRVLGSQALGAEQRGAHEVAAAAAAPPVGTRAP